MMRDNIAFVRFLFKYELPTIFDLLFQVYDRDGETKMYNFVHGCSEVFQ